MGRLRIADLHVELRRRGGWSWGPDPRGLAESLQRALPAMVAQELRRLLPRELSGRVTAPIRVELKVSAAELAELLAGAERTVPGAGLPGRVRAPRMDRGGALEQLATRVRARLAQSIAELPPASIVLERKPARASEPTTELDDDELATRWAGSLLRMLATWRRQGDLGQLLAAVRPASLRRWHDALLVDSPPRASERRVDVAGTLAGLRRTLEPIEHDDPQARRAAERLLLIVALHEQLGCRPNDPVVRAELDRALPLGRTLEPPGEARRPEARRPEARRPEARRPEVTQPSSLPARAPASSTLRSKLETGDELQLGCALPFVVLATLARLGWVELLGALLIEHHDLADAPALASALAFKLLPRPDRGWLRSTADERAAAAFAGERERVDEARRARVASSLADSLAPLDTLLTRALVRGRSDRDPLILLRAPIDHGDDTRGYLALELEGGFVLARALELDTLLIDPNLIHAPLLVPARAADPTTTRWLGQRGHEFLTDAPPGRDDAWQPIRRGRIRLWTSASEPSSFRPITRFVPRFEIDELERLRHAWTEVVARPGVLRGHRPELERSLGFAVHLALSDIAWNLWRTREPTDAALVYERFSDLDLRLRVERDRVRLLLPRGSRRDHLAASGMLADLDEVPWWPGRRLEWGLG